LHSIQALEVLHALSDPLPHLVPSHADDAKELHLLRASSLEDDAPLPPAVAAASTRKSSALATAAAQDDDSATALSERLARLTAGGAGGAAEGEGARERLASTGLELSGIRGSVSLTPLGHDARALAMEVPLRITGDLDVACTATAAAAAAAAAAATAAAADPPAGGESTSVRERAKTRLQAVAHKLLRAQKASGFFMFHSRQADAHQAHEDDEIRVASHRSRLRAGSAPHDRPRLQRAASSVDRHGGLFRAHNSAINIRNRGGSSARQVRTTRAN
jgi:hypothetical protein